MSPKQKKGGTTMEGRVIEVPYVLEETYLRDPVDLLPSLTIEHWSLHLDRPTTPEFSRAEPNFPEHPTRAVNKDNSYITDFKPTVIICD